MCWCAVKKLLSHSLTPWQTESMRRECGRERQSHSRAGWVTSGTAGSAVVDSWRPAADTCWTDAVTGISLSSPSAVYILRCGRQHLQTDNCYLGFMCGVCSAYEGLGSLRYLYSTYYELFISRHSGMAHVNDASHSLPCHPDVYPPMELLITIPSFKPHHQSFRKLLTVTTDFKWIWRMKIGSSKNQTFVFDI